MNSDETYNNIPTRTKEDAGFPANYCHLSIEQKFFVDSLAPVDIQSEYVVSETLEELNYLASDIQDTIEKLKKIKEDND